MTDSKDKKRKKKQEKDTDLTDEMGGGGEGSIFTREVFIRTLKKISRPLKSEKPSGEEKSKTSE